jgi:apolipoprotein N-acyltransferase
VDDPGPTYVKRSLVPFGEWIPFREILLPLIPQLRYVGAQSVPGTKPGILQGTLRNGRTANFGILICFDVAFDNVAYDLPNGDAQIIVVQSSNAMYQGSSQVEQQFAITRARAAELRREVLVVTTSGISGVIDPTGVPQSRVSSGAATGTVVMPLRNGSTPAAVIGIPLQQLVSLIAAAWLLVLTWRSKRRIDGLLATETMRF